MLFYRAYEIEWDLADDESGVDYPDEVSVMLMNDFNLESDIEHAVVDEVGCYPKHFRFEAL